MFDFCTHTHGKLHKLNEWRASMGQTAREALEAGTYAPLAPGPDVVASVMRCVGLMKLLLARGERPYRAQFTGTSKCALCDRIFRMGQEMVKCYVDPNPAIRWVHVACAQNIVTANGGPSIRPHVSLDA